MEFIDFIKQEKNKSDTCLKKCFDAFIKASADIDPHYGSFAQAIADLSLRGGKRIRPLLVRLSHDLVASKPAAFDLVQASVYVELLHIFILIHDDIADRDLKRYNGPTLEVKFQQELKQTYGHEDPHFGTSLALVAGDLLHVLGNGVMIDAQVPEPIKLQAMRHMQLILHQVIAGWHIHFWQNQTPLAQASTQRYLKGMKLVSASYTLQGPLNLGLILAQKQTEFGQDLTTFGYHVGMGFQIQDDILGVFGDTQTTGKPAGNDIKEGKKTLLVLNAYQKCSNEQKSFLEKNLGNRQLTSKQLDEIKDIIISTGSLKHSQTTAENHIYQALTVLDSLTGVNRQAQTNLKSIAEFVIKRDY